MLWGTVSVVLIDDYFISCIERRPYALRSARKDEAAKELSLCLSSSSLYTQIREQKSVNLRYITVGRLDDDMIDPPSDGPMFILINW